jgi:hypothetical protein
VIAVVRTYKAIRVKAKFTDAANTIVPCYLALIQRGLTVYREPSAVTQSGMLWVAESPTIQFCAEDLVTLLGLVALRETRNTDWLASDEEIETFLARFEIP